MRGDPVDAEQPPGPEIEVQLLHDLAACGGCGWLVGLAHPARQVPVGLVPGIDEQNAALLITDEHVGADPLAGLGGVAFGQVRLPRIGVTLVKRHIAGHRPGSTDVPGWCPSAASQAYRLSRWRRASFRLARKTATAWFARHGSSSLASSRSCWRTR